MKPDPDRQALIDQMTERFRKKLEEQYTDDTATLEQIEEAVERIGQDILPELQKKLANNAPRNPETIRSTAPVARRRVIGAWKPKPSLHAMDCLSGHGPPIIVMPVATDRLPWTAVWDWIKGETTPQVRLWVAYLAPLLGFAESAEALRTLREIDLSSSTVERIAVSVGTSLRKAQLEEADLHSKDRLPDKRTACPKRLYIGADGIMTPLREAWKKDGSLGKLTCRFGECKTGVVYETSSDKDGRDSRVRIRAYTATLEDVQTFEPLLGTLAHRCGYHAAKEVIVLGDGALWIWYLFGRQFPGAIQILDFYHACEHLAKVANAMYGKDTDLSRAWQKARQADLKANGVAEVVKSIQDWQPSTPEQAEIRRIESAYFADNAKRMRYQTYLEKGYQIGSGVVEATCKHVVHQRLDQAGMHWREASAEAIVTLRAAQLSTCPTDLRPHLGNGGMIAGIKKRTPPEGQSVLDGEIPESVLEPEFRMGSLPWMSSSPLWTAIR